MGDWPLLGGGPISTGGVAIASSTRTTVTSSASANTKGSWVQIIASTSLDARLMVVYITPASTGRRYLVDIGVGGAGSEQVIAANLMVNNSASQSIPFVFPVAIPAGSRISARSQAATGSSDVTVAVTLSAQGFKPSQPFGRVTAYGANTATSGGVTVNPGTTINTKGAWTQIDAACANPFSALVVAAGDATVTTMSLTDYFVDIAVGASGSEQIIVPDHTVRSSSAIISPSAFLVPTPPVPSGTRLAMRCSCATASQLLECALYGLD